MKIRKLTTEQRAEICNKYKGQGGCIHCPLFYTWTDRTNFRETVIGECLYRERLRDDAKAEALDRELLKATYSEFKEVK